MQLTTAPCEFKPVTATSVDLLQIKIYFGQVSWTVVIVYYVSWLFI